MSSKERAKKAEEERLRRIAALLNFHCNGSFYAIDSVIHELNGPGALNEAEVLEMLRDRVARYEAEREQIDQGIAELTSFLESYSEQGAGK